MDVSEIRKLSESEKNVRLAILKKEQFNLRFQLAGGQLDNTLRVREVRREIARIKTLIHEKNLPIST